MRVLLIGYTDSGGGAASGAVRLLLALRQHGADAWMGVAKKTTDCPFVLDMSRKRIPFVERCARRLFKMFVCAHFDTNNRVLHSYNLFSRLDVKKINDFDADCVNLHWVGGDTLSIRDIARIKGAIVWTMHDSWPVCGAEHHPNVLDGDERYKAAYTRANKPLSTKGFDMCRWTWERKKKWLAGSDITFVGVSRWESEVQKNSSLFGTKRGLVISNMLDENVFRIRNKAQIRDALGIAQDAKVLGFGAEYPNDPYKGGAYLLDVISILKSKAGGDKYFLLVFGNTASQSFCMDMPCFHAGFVSNPVLLSCIYNALDVFICPSLMESMSFTCLEAASCGVPVAAFRVGGIPDVVQSGVTGYLAKPYDSADLARGVEEILQDKKRYTAMCAAAREKAVRDFDSEAIVKKYMDVYSKAVTDRQAEGASCR